MPRPTLTDEPTVEIGPYRLAHRIAVGGMAEVFRALSPQSAGSDRAVVIKRLLPALVADPEQREMFEREARLGLGIRHPNVVSVLAHGTHEGAPFLVLEYVFGVDLFRLQRARRATEGTASLPVELACFIGRELLEGLAAVHEAKDERGAPMHIVHRDVSPSNLFLSVHGEVKLGDLGIAQAAEPSLPRGGRGFRAKGKLGYLPPEQVRGHGSDQRGDIYAASVVLAEMLLGRPLFGGGTEIGALLAIRDGDLTPLHAIRSSLPPELYATLLEGLERRPERRVASAKRLASRLERFAGAREEMRPALGRLVVDALDHADEQDRASLAETVEVNTVGESVSRLTPQPEASPEYEVAEGTTWLGPFTLAALVRSIATGEIGPTAEVRIDGLPSGPVHGRPELSRHLPPSSRTPSARRRVRLAETTEIYDLAPAGPLPALLELLRAKESGLLLCEHGEVRKEVYLGEGRPLFVTSNQPDELLGEHLVARALLTRDELDLALAVMPRFEGRLGETLLGLGLIEPVKLFREISRAVESRLVDIFTWERGHAAFYRGLEEPVRAFPLQLEPWSIFERGALARADRGLAPQMPRADAILKRTDRDLGSLELSDSLDSLLEACASPRTLGELEGFGPAASIHAGVRVLLTLGVIAWWENPPGPL